MEDHMRSNLKILCVFLTFMTSSALAAPSTARLKAIDFDEELVEGLNRRPLDSLQSIHDGRDRKRKTHLYRKRSSFRSELARSVRSAALNR